MNRLPVAAALIAAMLLGCSGPAGTTDDATEGTASPTAASAPATDGATAASAGPAEEVDGDVLPTPLIGAFSDPMGGSFSFYEPEDAFCSEVVNTQQNCYAVRVSDDPSADPVEFGVAAVQDDVLRLLTLQDPKADCVGATNESRWEESDDGVVLTPIDDCHGTQALELTRAP